MDAALAVTAALAVATAGANGVDLSLAALGKSLRAAVEKDPLEACLVTAVGSSVLFFLAEKGINPKVRTFEDALVYCTTCLSVGYSDIFAHTPTGKAIGSALMTFGPALTQRILDAPAREVVPVNAELLAVQRVIATKLDAILEEMRAARG